MNEDNQIEYAKEDVELALAAKRRAYGSTQLKDKALELFLDKKPFELERMLDGLVKKME